MMNSAERPGAENRGTSGTIAALRRVSEDDLPALEILDREIFKDFGFTKRCDEQPDDYGIGEPREVLHRSLATNPR